MSDKKRTLCPRCKRLEDDGDPEGKLKIRSCDEEGCGRHHCQHLGVRKEGKDTCGPCNLKSARAAATAKKADPPKGTEEGAPK